MQVIEQHPYVEQLLAPVAGEAPMGENLADDAALEYLEDEIMKVGSLSHNDIDWPRVESESLKLLADRSKDLKVLGFLMLSLQRGGDGERFLLSLYLLHRVLESWWEQAWPYPGANGQRARKMMFSQMLQRALKPVEGLSFDGSVGDGRQFALELVDRLTGQAADSGLADDLLSDLKRALGKLPKAGQAPAKAPAAVSAPAARPAEPAKTSSTSTGAGLGNLTLDPGNERATRQSLLKVAELLTETEPGNPLGYSLRRHAIWQSITGLPPTRDGTRTDLAAVSADRVAEYREVLEKAPDPELWQRIEQSASVSPFWLDGHWLSACTAVALGYHDCAEAIRNAVKAFTDRLPRLTELTFNDGTPFLSPDAQDWMLTAPAASASAGGDANAWEQAFQAALELVRQARLAQAMELMEKGLEDAREPRQRFYWRLASARLMAESGLKTLAAEQIRDLKAQVDGLVLDDWEPGLIKQLERLA